MRPLPQEIFVYTSDVQGKPSLGIAETIQDIPEGQDNSEVGVYSLQSTKVFTVKRELNIA